MKKILSVILILGIFLFLCSCKTVTSEPQKENPSAVSSEEKAPETIQISVAKELFERNLNCTLNIFDLKTLEYEETPVESTFCRVKDDKFKTFSDLEEYVYSTYVKEVADIFLIDRKLYKDVNGVLCIDTARIGGKGYYVDWENYDIKVLSGDEKECKIEVCATIEEPSDNPTKEAYIKTATAKNVDGNWLLTEIVY